MVSVAVATAMPIASAAPVSSLRRGVRAKDSVTMRRNIFRKSVGDSGRRLLQIWESHDDCDAIRARLHAHGVAATYIANRRDVDCRVAVAANDVLAVLAVAHPATNLAGIERDAPARWFVNHKKTDRFTTRLGGEEMHLAVVQTRERNAHLAILRRKRLRGGLSCHRASVNDLAREDEDHNQA